MTTATRNTKVTNPLTGKPQKGYRPVISTVGKKANAKQIAEKVNAATKQAPKAKPAPKANKQEGPGKANKSSKPAKSSPEQNASPVRKPKPVKAPKLEKVYPEQTLYALLKDGKQIDVYLWEDKALNRATTRNANPGKVLYSVKPLIIKNKLAVVEQKVRVPNGVDSDGQSKFTNISRKVTDIIVDEQMAGIVVFKGDKYYTTQEAWDKPWELGTVIPKGNAGDK